MFTATAIAYSCFQVPYVALPADLTPDHHERTRLVATRIAVVALATLALGAGGPAIRDAVGGSAGYAAMAVTAGAVIATGMSLASATAARPARRCCPRRRYTRESGCSLRSAWRESDTQRLRPFRTRSCPI
nr:MFS transporter [Nocardia coubleae]